jgi:alkanesulfonate monooxygenase SsuD/methylene tetrahydromethanopterin reductase-like flavin-dependent oxidoreductase (luciferase family)
LAVALEEPMSTFRGRWVEWRDMVVAPRPLQRPRPPIWAGGNSAAAAQRAALHADGWVPWHMEPEHLRERVELARQVRQRAGRTSDFEVVAPCHVGRADRAERVLERLRAWQSAGATAAHVGFESSSLKELLERMAFLQRDVVPLLTSEFG